MPPVKKSTSVKKMSSRKKIPVANRLYRSEKERVVAGVAGGLAQYFHLDPILVRVLFVVFAFLNGFGFFAYLLLWALLPKESARDGVTEESMRENVAEMKGKAEDVIAEVRSYSETQPRRVHAWFGWGLIIFGVFLLLRNFGILAPRVWTPALIIGLGLILLIR